MGLKAGAPGKAFGNRHAASGPSYDAEAAAYFTRASITNPDLKTLVNDFIVGAKAAFSATALSDFADSIQLVANQVAAGTVIDMTTNHYDGSLVNSPTFTQFREVVNAGSTDYMNDGFNPSTMGVRYQRDSKTYGFYLRTNPGNGQPVIGIAYAGGASQSLAYIDGGDGNDYLRDANGGGAVFSSSGRLTGHFALSRTASNLITGYHNGVARATAADASIALANFQGHLHGYDNAGSHAGCTAGTGFSLAYKLRGTTGAEMAAWHTLVNTLLTGVFAL